MRRITLLCALAFAGCGGEDSYENELRPPAPINVTAAIGADRIRISPRSFGAGPVVFIVSNQSGSPQRLTFETDEIGGAGGGITRSTREIADGATGTLKADPPEGTYTLSAESGVREVAIEVSERRESSQDELLLP